MPAYAPTSPNELSASLLLSSPAHRGALWSVLRAPSSVAHYGVPISFADLSAA